MPPQANSTFDRRPSSFPRKTPWLLTMRVRWLQQWTSRDISLMIPAALRRFLIPLLKQRHRLIRVDRPPSFQPCMGQLSWRVSRQNRLEIVLYPPRRALEPFCRRVRSNESSAARDVLSLLGCLLEPPCLRRVCRWPNPILVAAFGAPP